MSLGTRALCLALGEAFARKGRPDLKPRDLLKSLTQITRAFCDMSFCQYLLCTRILTRMLKHNTYVIPALFHSHNKKVFLTPSSDELPSITIPDEPLNPTP